VTARLPVLVAAAALTLAGCGGGKAVDAGPSAQPAANALHISPDGDDGAQCTQEEPCRSLARANATASPGDLVLVAPGSYGDQMLPRLSRPAGSEDVVFAAADGARPSMGVVSFGSADQGVPGADHVTMRGIDMSGVLVQRSRDLTFEDVDMRGFWIAGGSDISIRDARVGGLSDGSHPEISAWFDGRTAVPPRRILIEDVSFHDVAMGAPGDHVECLQATDVKGLVVRGSSFERCDTFDLRVDRYRTEGPSDVLIEENSFGAATDRFGGTVYYGLAVRAGSRVRILRNQSPVGWAGPELQVRVRDWQVAGNRMAGGACHPDIVYRGNVWTGGSVCGPGDRLAD
jgi:hypothetical protein